jgi:hypothetical protein
MQTVEKKVFNEAKVGLSRVFVNGKETVDIKNLASFMLKKLLPSMVENKETAFFWHFLVKDVSALTEELYQHEINRFAKAKFKKENFDTIWTVNFTMPDGEKMVAEIANEVWYQDDKDHPISPFAFLFDAPFAEGYMLSKVKFSKAA